ncbi:MAG: class I SAM-dependent methyltransferase [Actinobacteria bacterium]|nr:class I SAM-dependent methyltransferase [Actinomycetota bacterium]
MPYWKTDDTTEWLTAADFLISMYAAELSKEETGTLRILETGVWKGGWLISMVANTEPTRAIGIDPYPGGATSVRERFLHRVEDEGFSEEISLYASWAELERSPSETSELFDLIHIDGEHTEAAVKVDLENAEKVLAAHGLIAVDDFRHPYFPGIAAATFNYLHESDLCIVMMSNHKAFLCRTEYYSTWYKRLHQKLIGASLKVERHIFEDAPENARYIQMPNVNGRPPLLVVDPVNDEVALSFLTSSAPENPTESIEKATGSTEPAAGSNQPPPKRKQANAKRQQKPAPPSTVRRLARDWLPPKVSRGIVKLRSK